jgi:hypothetical protein
MVDQITRNFRKFLVGRLMFCPINGEVLDVDKSVFILDADEDACMVVSQKAWAAIVKSGIPLTTIFSKATPEWHVDETTVRPSE